MKNKPAPTPTPYQPGEVCYEVSADKMILFRPDGTQVEWENRIEPEIQKHAGADFGKLANKRKNEKTPLVNGAHCRDWTGSLFPLPPAEQGTSTKERRYGRIAVRFKRGPRRGKVKSTQAHRESRKAFAPGFSVGSKNVVCHDCDRPICVEPKHLWGGIPKQNVRDCVAKGRHKTPFRRKNGERYTAKAAT